MVKGKIAILMMLGMFLFSFANVSGALADSLQSYWAFEDNNANTTVHAQVGTTGTLSGGNTADKSVSAKVGLGFDLDGTGDYVTVVDAPDRSGNVTFNFWINPDSLTGQQNLYDIAGDGTVVQFIMSDGVSDGKIRVLFVGGPDFKTTVGVGAGQWTMVTVIWDESSSTAYAYLNALANGSHTNGAGGSDGSATTTIGDYAGNKPFAGPMDEVVVWERALSQAEITELYNSGDGLSYSQIIDDAPVISLGSPINTFNTSTATVTFTANVTDNYELSNVSLYIDGVLNQTNSSGFNGSYSFVKYINDGNHNWSILAYDNESQSTQSSTRTFTVDTTDPVITATVKNFTYQQVLTDNQVINFSLTETNQNTCWYNYNGTNNTFNCSASGFFINLTQGDTDIYLYANDTIGNEGNDYFNWTETATIITFNVLNYLGDILSSITFGGDITYTGNPATAFMSDYINNSVKATNLSLQIVDNTFYNKNTNFTTNVNNTVTTYNLTILPNQLVIEFLNQTGTTNNTKFEIFTSNGSLFANDSASMVVVQQNLSLGLVKIRFNQPLYGTNWSQFYEYENTYLTHITDNLTLLDDADWTIYFEIKGKDNRVIEDAVLRAEFTTATEGQWTNPKLVGQRVSGPDGKTFFLFDSSTHALITVTASGYQAKVVPITVGDEDASTKSESYTIYLETSESGVSNNVWVGYPKWFTNRTLNIHALISAKGRDQVKINTNERVDKGLGQRELPEIATGYFSGREMYNATLIPEQDFYASNSGNLIVYIYVDGVNIYNWTIEEKTPTRIFDLPSDVDDETIIMAGSVALIFISGAIAMIFTSSTAGFTTFMFGSMILSLLNSSFLWLTFISLLYFVLKLTRRVLGE